MGMIVGQKIVDARVMTPEEMSEEGWDYDNCGGNPVVLILENGTKIFPSCDDEGNDSGVFFIKDNKNNYLRFQ